MSYKISIVMPALNEEKNISGAIHDVIDAFKKLMVHGEIIVIDDGSRDKTAEVVKGLQRSYDFIRLIRNETNHGLGAAFWTGVRAAKGEIVTWVPGDGENDTFETLRYLPIMNHVDVLVPFIFNREVRSLGRRVISKIYKTIINLSFGLLLNYMNGTVVYRRALLQNLVPNTTGFFFQTEILIKVIKQGYLFAEVPCALRVRTHGKSKAIRLKSLINVIRGYIETMLAIHIFDRPKMHVVPNTVTYTRRKQFQSLPALNLNNEQIRKNIREMPELQ